MRTTPEPKTPNGPQASCLPSLLRSSLRSLRSLRFGARSLARSPRPTARLRAPDRLAYESSENAARESHQFTVARGRRQPRAAASAGARSARAELSPTSGRLAGHPEPKRTRTRKSQPAQGRRPEQDRLPYGEVCGRGAVHSTSLAPGACSPVTRAYRIRRPSLPSESRCLPWRPLRRTSIRTRHALASTRTGPGTGSPGIRRAERPRGPIGRTENGERRTEPREGNRAIGTRASSNRATPCRSRR